MQRTPLRKNQDLGIILVGEAFSGHVVQYVVIAGQRTVTHISKNNIKIGLNLTSILSCVNRPGLR